MYWFNIKKNKFVTSYLFVFVFVFFSSKFFFNQTLCTLRHVGELTMLCCVNRARVLFLILFLTIWLKKKTSRLKPKINVTDTMNCLFMSKQIRRYEKNVLSLHIEPLYRPTAKCVTYVEIKHMNQAWLFNTC